MDAWAGQILFLAFILLLLLVGSLAARIVRETGRFRLFWMLFVLSLISSGILVFLYFLRPYTRNDALSLYLTSIVINFIGIMLIGYGVYSATLFVMRLFTSRKIANASATIMAGGLAMTFGTIVSGVAYLDAIRTDSAPIIRELIFTTMPDWGVMLKLSLVGMVASIVFGAALFGLGSMFTVRVKDGILIALMGILVPLIASIVVAIFVGQLVTFQETAFQATVESQNNYIKTYALILEIGIAGGAIIGMYIGGTVADVMKGINVGLDMIGLVILTLIASSSIAANPMYIGMGLRGFILVVALVLLVLQAYLMRDVVPLTLTILIALTVGGFLLLGQNTWSVGIVVGNQHWAILFAALALICLFVFAGRFIANRIERRYLLRESLMYLFLGLLASLPILYLANI